MLVTWIKIFRSPPLSNPPVFGNNDDDDDDHKADGHNNPLITVHSNFVKQLP